MTNLHNRSSLEVHDTAIPLGDLSHIMQIAHDNAVACVNADPEFYRRLTGRQAPEPEVNEEQALHYRKAASVLEAPYLSNRQQQVAAGIALLVGANPQNHYTQRNLQKECQAQARTVSIALSVLTGIRNEFTPSRAQMAEYPLLVGVHARRHLTYAPTVALRWLIEQPDETVPEVFRAVRRSGWAELLIDNS